MAEKSVFKFREASKNPELQKCLQHNGKQIEFYCKDHDIVCCSTCAVITHKKCDSIVPVEEAACGIKNSNVRDLTMDKLRKCQSSLRSVVAVLEANNRKLQTQTSNLRRKLVETRLKVNHLFDEFEKTLSSANDCMYEKESSRNTLQADRCRHLFTTVEGCVTILESAVMEGKEEGIFVILKQIDSQIRGFEKIIDQENSKISLVNLFFDEEIILENFLLQKNPEELIKIENIHEGTHDLEKF
ncbi:hypothetical protein CHS0354_042466 [Potamilus streckersoni]|uniref:B box-type domain-containing protein n=1 Tax=Potamilus streckersoni TaxID=2493646 RepID=A0AAE0S9E1_9BIVA|nr:hypothetical protein CHS0354_042466 [Potamilus streckersoni]